MFICKSCGAFFELKGKQRNRDYCSRKCYKRAWASSNYSNEKYRKNKPLLVKRKYGISETEYKQMIKEWKGCEICGDKKHTPHIDHCHTTGQVRGLLCRNCNAGLGQFKDDKSLLEKAIHYLGKIK